MVDDPLVDWHQAHMFSIRLKDPVEYWEAGHVTDVLIRWGASMLVTSETGGVWSIGEQDFSALPLSDSWATPDMQCLALGPDGTDHVFAGGNGLYVTDASAPAPLFAWHRLTSLDKVTPGTVQRISVLDSVRRIVVTCSNGIFWSDIPPAGPPPAGCLAALFGYTSPAWSDKYSWRSAKGSDLPSGGFFGLAIGWTGQGEAAGWQRNLSEISVVVGGTKSARGVFVGQWDSTGDLVMRRAHFSGALDLVQLAMAATDISVCVHQPSVLYAIASDDLGKIAIVLRSNDGGNNWDPCSMKVTSGNDLAIEGGEQGDDGWNICIGVSPFDANLVAIGWQHGPFFSADGGQTWSQADGIVHADIHKVCFDPRIAVSVGNVMSECLFVCTDGGIVSTCDRGHTFESRYNQRLLNLQFYGALARQAWGSTGPSPQFPGFVGGGLQDNGNVYAELSNAGEPFFHLDGGDGGFFTPLPTGQVLHNTGLQEAPEPVRASMWDGATHAFQNPSVVGIAKNKPPLQPDAGGLVGVKSLELVKRPRFKRDGRFMYAVASTGLEVFGLFALPNGDKIAWEYLGVVPAAPGASAWSVASVDGTAVFVGVEGARIFSLDPFTGAVVEYLYDATFVKAGTVSRIVPYSNTRAFAIQNWSDSSGEHGTVIALRGLAWKPAGAGLPDQKFYSLEGARHIDNDMLLAATDDRVFVSYNEAASWSRASKGLPRNPHCADLRFVKTGQGEQRIYLSSYGRSLWVATLMPDVGGTVHTIGGVHPA